MDRRSWLEGACAMLVAGDNAAAAPRLDIGLQLYTVAEALQRDLDGTLAKIAAIGYRTLELAGLHGHGVETLRGAAERHGVRFRSMHVAARASAGEPGLDGDIGELAASAHRLGVLYVVLPFFPIPERLPARGARESFPTWVARIVPHLTAADWQRTAQLLNERGVQLAREGLQLGYHNHNPELAPLGSSTGLDILLRETDAKLVTFELDAGWVAAAGVDPLALLRQYADRVRLMHVKDILPSTKPNFSLRQDPTEVGRGRIDWRALLEAARAAGVREYFVEQEPPFTRDRFEAIADSFAYLSRLQA